MNAPLKAADFRLDDPNLQADPYPFYPLLRESAPVLETSFGDQPCWVVSRRADVDTVLMNPAVYSSRTTPVPSMLFADPPEHTRLRKMTGAMFARVPVAQMEDRIVALAEGLIAPIVDRGACDIVADYAGPLTVSTIALMLGISIDDVEAIRQLGKLRAEAVMAMRLGKQPSPQAKQASDELLALMGGLAYPAAHTPDGVVAALAAQLAEGRLKREEFVAYTLLLFAAGHSTTTNLIANATYVLTQQPSYLERLRSEPDFAPQFVEEVLRMRPSFHRLLRITTQETELAGVTIPAGAIVRVLLASANRDPAVYEAAEEFDPDAERRANIAFGRGIHTCLGNWLARLEAATAMRVLAKQAETVSLDPAREPEPLVGGTFNEFGFERLPVLVQKRAG